MHELQHLATIERIKDTTNRANFLRLDMNENPEGLPQEFVESVKQEITASFLATYPNDESFLQTLARFLEIPRENLHVQRARNNSESPYPSHLSRIDSRVESPRIARAFARTIHRLDRSPRKMP